MGYHHVYIVGCAAMAITLAAYLLFRRTFGWRRETLPLLVFTAGSPFFFKNFAASLGYFDIFGALVAILALLLPTGRFFLVLIGAATAALLLTHHLHILLYAPLIIVIAVLWLRADAKLDPEAIAIGALMACGLGVLFVYLMFFGKPGVTPETFIAAMRARALDPVDVPHVQVIWYAGLADELRRTANLFATQALRLPVYLLLIAAHWPLIRFGKALVCQLSRTDRLLVYGAAIGMTAGYLIIFVIAFDYARWVSNWGVCMILLLHAVSFLPRSAEAAPVLDNTDTHWMRTAGWVITLIPRVGVIRPF